MDHQDKSLIEVNETAMCNTVRVQELYGMIDPESTNMMSSEGMERGGGEERGR